MMGVPLHLNNAPLCEQKKQTTSNTLFPDITTHSTNSIALSQMDGGADHHLRTQPTATENHYTQSIHQPPFQRQQHLNQPARQPHNMAITQPPLAHQQSRTTGNAVNDLLPYCTMEPPLNGAQVIALSDVVDSLRELMLLALAAGSGERDAAEKLEGAVGHQVASSIVEFFADEWEIEG
jgi:hypothetical protein